jgi:hypothetical protein
MSARPSSGLAGRGDDAPEPLEHPHASVAAIATLATNHRWARARTRPIVIYDSTRRATLNSANFAACAHDACAH